MRKQASCAALAATLVLAGPAQAQQLGKGGTGVDETTELPRCAVPLGVVAMVEEKTADPMEQLPPGMAALVRLAEAQNGGNGAKVDTLPLLKLMASRSGCFRVADRGGALTALQAERQIAGGGYTDTPVGKVTTLAMLDAFRKLIGDAQPRLAARTTSPTIALPSAAAAGVPQR